MEQTIKLPVGIGNYIYGDMGGVLKKFRVYGYHVTESSTWISAWNDEHGSYYFYLDLLNYNWFLKDEKNRKTWTEKLKIIYPGYGVSGMLGKILKACLLKDRSD